MVNKRKIPPSASSSRAAAHMNYSPISRPAVSPFNVAMPAQAMQETKPAVGNTVQFTKVTIKSSFKRKTEEVIPGTAEEDTDLFQQALHENEYTRSELNQIMESLEASASEWDLEMIERVEDAIESIKVDGKYNLISFNPEKSRRIEKKKFRIAPNVLIAIQRLVDNTHSLEPDTDLTKHEEHAYDLQMIHAHDRSLAKYKTPGDFMKLMTRQEKRHQMYFKAPMEQGDSDTSEEEGWELDEKKHKSFLTLLNSKTEVERVRSFTSRSKKKRKKAMVGGGKKAKDPETLESFKEFLTHRNPKPIIKRYGIQEAPDPKDFEMTSSHDKDTDIDAEVFIPQFRGLHYPYNSFSDEMIEKHSQLDERHEPVYPSSTLMSGSLGVGGYYELFNNKDDEEEEKEKELREYQKMELEKSGRGIYDSSMHLLRRKSTAKVQDFVGRNTKNFKPLNLLDTRTHFYSQSYDKHARAQKDAVERKESNKEGKYQDQLFEGMTNSGNPIVSTGDIPYHSTKYAFGLKPYSGHEQEVRTPKYDQYGHPFQPIVGKMYGAMMLPSDYRTQVVPHLSSLQNQGRINIGKTIIPERESQFFGKLSEDRVEFQRLAKYPDFRKKFSKGIEQKYGLTEEMFNAYKQAFRKSKIHSTKRKAIEANLSFHEAQYNDMVFMETSQMHARKKRKKLVFRKDSTTFSEQLLKLGKIGSKPGVLSPMEKIIILANDNNLVIVDVIPDGNCLFAAIRYQLRTMGIDVDIRYLRERLTALVLNNPEYFQPFAVRRNLNGLVDNIMSNYNWNNTGGDIAAQAIATVLQQTIFVLTPNGVETRNPIGGLVLNNATVDLVHNVVSIAYNGYNHYLSTRPK